MLDYTQFAFPLNVYAHVLTLDYGRFQYLHYGLFETGQDSVVAAQENASRLFFSKLPPPPARILEVGIGLGATLSRLVQAGYDAVGITPDEPQIAYAKNLHGASLPAVCAKLEDFSADQPFDWIVFQESAQYIDTAALFRQAFGLLREGGRMLIMDEMSLRPGPADDPGLPWVERYLSLAADWGFQLEEQLDLSALAAPTNDYILDAVARHRERLLEDLDLDAAALAGLLDSARAYWRKYREGRYGYGLLLFTKNPAAPKWQAGWAGPADEAELLDLFRRAFGNDMAPALWRWKYDGLNPCGASVRRDGRLVAFYGGIPRKIKLFGCEASAVQIGDVMVDPAERGILTRCGPFFLAAEHYLKPLVGPGKRFPVAFGFPSERPYRLGQRLGVYGKGGELMRIDWPALDARPSLVLRLRPLEASAGAAVDRLWLEMAEALSRQIVGVRDFAYLRRRYLEHPTIRYRVYLVTKRLGGQPFGLVVVRELDGELELLDLIAPPERLAALVHSVRRLAFGLGKPKVYTWITAQHAARLAGSAGTVSPAHIIIPALAWPQATPPAEIDGHWWLMGGDTDFR